MDLQSMIYALSGGNLLAIDILIQWVKSDPTAQVAILTLDSKRLYDSRIGMLYTDVCGEDIERFKYHVQVELPNQETGQLSVTGPLSPSFENKEFWETRKNGKPGSYWALDNPPTSREYEYPIN